MQYLSDEWIEAADRALSEAWKASEAPTDGSSTLGYTVTAAPQGKVNYHLFVGPDGAGVASGKADDPDATMELDYSTAVEIATGETSAQVAFMQGRLKLGGDVKLLIEGAARLDAVRNTLSAISDVEY